MKYCEEKYPMGSFPKQRSAGRYVDATLYDNLDILAKKITDDNTFLATCFSSTFEVGTGKSVFMQQLGECYTDRVNKRHGLNIPFTTDNIVFKPKDLIETAFKLPKYSCIILDEWEDAHYWSELGITLRQFFRKCRQLNLFIIIIIPNFFQLNIGYAVSRSIFAIDVRFEGEFERGYFRFYNFDRKKDLYLKGKKTYNYNVTQANFNGRFTKGYVVGEEAYRRKKDLDLREQEEIKEKPTEREIKSQLFLKIYENLEGMTIKKLANAFDTSERTGKRWISEVRKKNEGSVSSDEGREHTIMTNPIIKEVTLDSQDNPQQPSLNVGDINRQPIK